MMYEDMIKVLDQVDICKVDDEASYSFMAVKESEAEFHFIKFIVPQEMTRVTTFAVTQKGCRTEEANGMEFDLNDYTRRVNVGFCKVSDPNSLDENLENLDPDNFEQVNHGEKERSPYALRDTFIEF